MTRGAALAGMSVLSLVVAAMTVPADAQPVSAPHTVGQWTAPFEEGGARVPRCVDDGAGGYACKPTAVTSIVLPDGRLLYFNGIEGYENNDGPAAVQHANRSADSQARLLDLRSGTPRFAVPSPDRGGATNPNIRPGHASADDPLGMTGVPGRPGDGPFGSTWGQLGLPPHEPTSSPDDPALNDGDLFCADVTLLADGRVLAVGGTDFYNEPAVLDQKKGDPADVGLIELEGLRSVRLFDPATDGFAAGNPMKYGRWYPSLVVMPDGGVLTAGGTTKVIKNAQGGHVRRTETYDPVSGTWAENYVGRASENTLPQAARLNLMPDGKVYYAGVGHMNSVQFGFAVDEALFAFSQRYDPAARTWEVLGPALLGARGNAFQVMLPLTPPYDSAELLVFGGNSDQRSLLLPFERTDGDHLRATAPPDGVAAPPGFYYLVVNTTTDQGPVPSVARVVRVGEGADPAEAVQPFPDDAPAPVGGSATDPSDPSVPQGSTGPGAPTLIRSGERTSRPAAD